MMTATIVTIAIGYIGLSVFDAVADKMVIHND